MHDTRPRLRHWAFVLLWSSVIGPSSFGAEPAPRFTDVTAASGITIAKNTGVGGTNPHAVAVEDFDGDGKPDIIIATFGEAPCSLLPQSGRI